MLNFKNWGAQEILNIIDKAIEVKQNPENYRTASANKSLVMIFQKHLPEQGFLSRLPWHNLDGEQHNSF